MRLRYNPRPLSHAEQETAVAAGLADAGLSEESVRYAWIRWESQIESAMAKRVAPAKIVAWICAALAGTADYRRGPRD